MAIMHKWGVYTPIWKDFNYEDFEKSGDAGEPGEVTRPLIGRYKYYSEIIRDPEKGYILSGQTVTKSRGEYPPVGYYYYAHLKYEFLYKRTQAQRVSATSGEKFETFTLPEGKKDERLKEVLSEDRNAYPDNGVLHGYWYVYEGIVNQPPTISGTDEDLGGKKGAFSKTFSVDDGDAGQELNIVVKLNGAQIQSISNATRKQLYTVDIGQATFDNLTLNAVNTIEISVSDGNGATAVRRWTFTRSNSNPTVSVEITNAGEQNLPFSVTFTPDDQDEDEITCKVFIDDVQVADLGSVTRGEKKTYALGKMDFSKLRNGAHKVKIEITDTNGGKGYGFVDFTKNLTSAYYKFTKETEGQALFVTVQLMAEIAEGAKVTVKVCNNALDADPTWEEVPSEKVGGEYKFSNSTKTAGNWAVGIWIQIDRGTATKDSYWYGAVGSYR